MLRLRDGQADLFDAVMPPEAKVLSAELAAVDTLLDDDKFLAPFVARFSCPIGRPTIPIETYLRLMYLKHRYTLGYETLVEEVADSLSWRRFSRIGLQDRVPHSTTILKLTRRFGPEIVEELNRETLKAAVKGKDFAQPSSASRLHGDGRGHQVPHRLWSVHSRHQPAVASRAGSEGGGFGTTDSLP